MPTTEADRFQALLQADPVAAQKVLEAVKRTVFVPHAGGQADVMASPARFRAVRAGRRWGKTKLAARELINRGLSNPGSMNWWVANSYKNVRRGYREVLRQLPRELLAKPAPSPTANDLILYFKNGSQLEFYSGGSPDALAGEGVDFVVVDEAALIPEAVWFQLIRPTLMDNNGDALIISTPRGKNWFHKVWYMGQDRRRTDYASWHFTSYDNPTIDNEEIDEAKSTLPYMIYQQEIMAEFLDNAASIFRWDDKLVLPHVVEPKGQIFMGIDLAKKEDFTVLTASRAEDRMPCFHERFNDISWPAQRERIHDAVEYLNGLKAVEAVTVGIDSTGIGDVMFDDLEDEGLDVIPVKFTNEWKRNAVMLLAADLERGQAFLLDEQTTEFGSYEYEINPQTGRYKFEAATGHDDEVSAKLIEHWIANSEAPPAIQMLDAEDDAPVEDEDDEELEILVPDNPRTIMMRPEVWNTS